MRDAHDGHDVLVRGQRDGLAGPFGPRDRESTEEGGRNIVRVALEFAGECDGVCVGVGSSGRCSETISSWIRFTIRRNSGAS